MSPTMDDGEARELKPLVCLCVYDRRRTCDKWLRAWHNADKHGGRVVVVHNFDPNPGSPKVEQVNRILRGHPDYYVPRVNRAGDIGAFQDMLLRRDEFPYWNAIVWFADDCLPMRRDFLTGFLDKLSQPDVGLVAPFYEPVPVPHVRTCCFAIKREVAMRLQFPPRMLDLPKDRYAFEHGQSNMYRQVIEMGYRVALAYGDYETPWCNDQSLIWDVDHCFNHDLWHIYERQFEGDHANEDRAQAAGGHLQAGERGA